MQVFELPSVKSFNLMYDDANELGEKLLSSFISYESKDMLVIVAEDLRKPKLLNKIPYQTKVEIISMEALHLRTMHSVSDSSSNKYPSGLIPDEKYIKEELEAVRQIQHFWRSKFPKIKQRRQHMQSAEAQVVQKFVDLGTQYSVPLALRALFITKAVEAHLKLPNLQVSIAQKRETLMSWILTVEISDHFNEVFETAVQLLSELDEWVGDALALISTENLGSLLKTDDLTQVKGAIENVENISSDTQDGLMTAEKIMEGMYSLEP